MARAQPIVKDRAPAGVARAPAPGDAKSGQVPTRAVKPTAGTVGALAGRYLSRQLDVMLDDGLQPSSEEHAPGKFEAALRRAEASVRVCYPIFEPGASAQLSEELAWIALPLGEVGALEVLAGRLRSRLGALPDHLVVGPVLADVDWRLGLEQDSHRGRLGAALGSERYQQLLGILAQWRVTPPLTRKAEQPGSEITSHVTRAVDDFDAQLASVLLDDAPDQASLAQVAARRVRYVAEISDTLGRKLSKRIARVRRLETLLDELVASRRAAHFLGRVGLDGEHNGFTYGLVHEQELRVAAALRTRLEEVRSR
jgi:hypothetical protein